MSANATEIIFRTLVVGWGNPLRGDDGTGRLLAEELEDHPVPGVEAVALHQLVPEVAAKVAEAARVVFVDARADASAPWVRLERIHAAATGGRLAHAFAPAGLLELARDVYHAEPEAWLLSVAGFRFDHGEGLSPSARRAAASARAPSCIV
ncbi:MAG: hydrogenase maturation protease [Kiritimatiellia bacterium]